MVNHLVNKLDYKTDNIEIEKEYSVKAGHSKLTPRIDILVKDDKGNPFFFIEAKAPDKYEKDKSEIEGQLFSLAQTEEKDFKTKVRYLVYYTIDIQEEGFLDKALIIDFEKYRTYEEWENEGFISVGTELTPGYGEPKKQPLVKGDEKNDLRTKINREEIEDLGRNLHNVLWGGGGTNDSEIFYSLVNVILAKIQDEYEKEDKQEYDFQIYQYGNHIESPEKVYERINQLYKRALKEQLNVVEQQRIDADNVINRNKFPLNKLIYTVQSLEKFSFLEGRSSLSGKDILGDFFESITRDGFKQTKGQFFTPTPIVNFLLYALQLDQLSIEKLNNDKELPLIIDPSAGSGTYLVEAMKLITKEVKYKQYDKIRTSKDVKWRFEELFKPDYQENKWARTYLYGSEINFDLGTASKVNMILHGDGSTNIFVKDGLLPFRFYKKETSPNYLETANTEPLYNDKEINAKFDIAISNPPFSVSLDTQTQREVKKAFVFGDKKNSENLFIERYYQILKEGGRLGVVLPESVFDTTENKYIRLFLFKYFNIKAIVSLPQLTFEPYTSTASMDAEIKESIDNLDKLDTRSPNYEEELEKEIDRLVKAIPLQNKKTLTHYVARRKLVLDLLDKILARQLQVQQQKGNYDEALIHNLLFQKGSNNTGNSDLWIINEDFIYFKGSSEKQLSKLEIDGERVFKDEFSEEEERYLSSLGENRKIKRPDVLLFPEEGKCIIIEFKAPQVNASDHLTQIDKYAGLIRNYTEDKFQITTFYGYLLGESIEPRDVRGAVSTFEESYQFDYLFRPSAKVVGFENRKDGSIYTEVIKYSTLLERAKQRNKIFIDKLN